MTDWRFMTWQERLASINEGTGYSQPGIALDMATAPWQQAQLPLAPQRPDVNLSNLLGIPGNVTAPIGATETQYADPRERDWFYRTQKDEQAQFDKSLMGKWEAKQKESGWAHVVGGVLGVGGDALYAMWLPYHYLSKDVLSPIVHYPLVMMSSDFMKENALQHRDIWDTMKAGWHEADMWGEKDSFGRGLVTNLAVGADLVLPSVQKGGGLKWNTSALDGLSWHEINAIQERTGFGFASANADLAANIFLDPLIVLGKVGKVSRVFRTTFKLEQLTRPQSFSKYEQAIYKGQEAMLRYREARKGFGEGTDKGLGPWQQLNQDRTLANVAKLPGVQDFLVWSEGKNRAQIAKHAMIRESPQAGRIAELLEMASLSDKELLLRIGMDDNTAVLQMRGESQATFNLLSRLRDDHFHYATASDAIADPQLAVQELALRKRISDLERKHAAQLKWRETDLKTSRAPKPPASYLTRTEEASGLKSAWDRSGPNGEPAFGTRPTPPSSVGLGPPSPFTPLFAYTADNFEKVSRPTLKNAATFHEKNVFDIHQASTFDPIYYGTEQPGLWGPQGLRVTPQYLESLKTTQLNYIALMAEANREFVPGVRKLAGYDPATGLKAGAQGPALPPGLPRDFTAKTAPGLTAKELKETNALRRAWAARGSGYTYSKTKGPRYRFNALHDATNPMPYTPLQIPFKWTSLDDVFATHTGPMKGQLDLFGKPYVPAAGDLMRQIRSIDDQLAVASVPRGIQGSKKTYMAALQREKAGLEAQVRRLNSDSRAVARPVDDSHGNFLRSALHAQERGVQHYDYGAATVADMATKFKGQMDLFDDLLGQEIKRLDDHVHWYESAVRSGENLKHLPTEIGITGSLTLVPKGGKYGKYARNAADRRYKRDLAYSRGLKGAYQGSKPMQKGEPTLPTGEELTSWVPGKTPEAIPGESTFVVPQRIYNGRLGAALHVIPAYGYKTAERFRSFASPALYNPNDLEAWRTLDAWLKQIKGLPGELRGQWVREHMALHDAAAKLAHVEQIEANVFVHAANRVGGIRHEVTRQLLQKTLAIRKAQIDKVTGAGTQAELGAVPGKFEPGTVRGSAQGQYAAANEGLRPDVIERDGSVGIAAPLLRTELLNNHVLLPMDKIQKALWQDRFLARWGVQSSFQMADSAMAFSNFANKIWKGSVLFRPGYVARTLADELLVGLSAVDTLLYTAQLGRGSVNKVKNLKINKANRALKRENKAAQRGGGLPVTEEYATRHKIGQEPISQGTRPGRKVMQTVVTKDRNGNAVYTQIEKDLEDDQFYSPGLFAEGARVDVNRAMTGTNQSAMFELYGNRLEQRMAASDWGNLNPITDEINHIPAWLHALNNIFSKDELARLALQGATGRELVKFLKSPAGEVYSKGNMLMRSNPVDWSNRVVQMVEDYTIGNKQLRDLALEGKVTAKWIQENVAKEYRPQVHGGEIDWTMGNIKVDRLLGRFYRYANELPTNALVRHPVADILYRQRLNELVASAKSQGVDPAANPAALYQMEEISRQHAIKQLRLIFKDELFASPTGALRFITPFFGAWRGSLARWGRQMGEDPAKIQRANQLWQGLHKPFDLVNENETPIQGDEGLFVKREDGILGLNTKARMVVRLPEPFLKALGIKDFAPAVYIPPRSFNTSLSGDPWYNPGFGPFMTVPVTAWLTQLSKFTPAFAEPFVNKTLPYQIAATETLGILPYGPQSMTKTLLPSVAGNIGLTMDEGDARQSIGLMKNIASAEYTNWELGLRDEPTMKEIAGKAHMMTIIDLLARWISPVSYSHQFSNPQWTQGVPAQVDANRQPVKNAQGQVEMRQLPKEWQYLLGVYRGLRDNLGYQGAQEAFYQNYPEAYTYLLSVSKNNAGIPANYQSWDKSARVQHLMDVAPDIFSSVAGIKQTDRDSFDKEVYVAQTLSSFKAGTKQRTFTGLADMPHDFGTQARINEGWFEFSKYMDRLDNAMAERQVTTLEDPRAADLKERKTRLVQLMKEKYREWWNEYTTPDKNHRADVQKQLVAVSQDPKLLKDRPDVQVLAEYMSYRKRLEQELMARKDAGGYSNLQRDENVDLLNRWNYIKDKLRMNPQNGDYAELWANRWLENDYLQELA